MLTRMFFVTSMYFLYIPKMTKMTKGTKIFYIAYTDLLCIPKISKKTK